MHEGSFDTDYPDLTSWAVVFKDIDPDTGEISQIKIVKNYEDKAAAEEDAWYHHTNDENPNRDYYVEETSKVEEYPKPPVEIAEW